MSSSLRRVTTVVAGLAIMLGTGTAAFADTPAAPVTVRPITTVCTVPGTPAGGQPAKPVAPGTLTVPAKRAGTEPTVPIVTVPGGVATGKPGKPGKPGNGRCSVPVGPGAPSVPGQPITTMPARPLNPAGQGK